MRAAPVQRSTANQNLYFRIFSDSAFSALQPAVERVTLRASPRGVCYCPFPPGYYFPLDSAMAVETVNAKNEASFFMFAGPNELLPIVDTVSNRRFSVISEGTALRVDPAVVKEFLQNRVVSQRGSYEYLFHFLDARERISMLNSSCYGHHPHGQRLARLLLEAGAAVPHGRPIEMSQHQLGRLVAARRPTITAALHEFCECGAIEIRRSEVNILDLDRLAAVSCGCEREAAEIKARAKKSIEAVVGR